MAACQGQVAPSPTLTAPSNPAETVEPSGDDCIPGDFVGAFSRERTADNTTESDLLGSWTLTIGPCDYVIAVDGIEQGGGRLELADGDAEAGRFAVSEDLGCPNEFTGEALYDFTFDGVNLGLEEAIAGTDQCAGRAAAFSGSPEWSR